MNNNRGENTRSESSASNNNRNFNKIHDDNDHIIKNTDDLKDISNEIKDQLKHISDKSNSITYKKSEPNLTYVYGNQINNYDGTVVNGDQYVNRNHSEVSNTKKTKRRWFWR